MRGAHLVQGVCRKITILFHRLQIEIFYWNTLRDTRSKMHAVDGAQPVLTRARRLGMFARVYHEVIVWTIPLILPVI